MTTQTETTELRTHQVTARNREHSAEIAETIRQQLGGRALFMLGAKGLMGLQAGLAFRVGRNAKGVTHVQITLAPDDTYTILFLAVRKHQVREKARAEMVHVESMHRVIEAETGLYTSL